MENGFTKIEAKVDTLMWRFLTFGVGTVLLGVRAFAGKALYYDGKMKDDVMKISIDASETRVKSDIGKDIRVLEDRLIVKLDQMKR